MGVNQETELQAFISYIQEFVFKRRVHCT